jgi:hypothetical protein
MVTVPAPQRALPTPVGTSGSGFTVAGTAVRVAEVQPVVALRAAA